MDAFWHEECFCCQTCRKTITSSYVEKARKVCCIFLFFLKKKKKFLCCFLQDGWPYHGDCVKGKQAPSVPTVPKVSPQKGGGGGGGGGYSNSSSAPPPPSSSSSAGGALAPCAGCNQKIEQGSAVTVSGKRYHAVRRNDFVLVFFGFNKHQSLASNAPFAEKRLKDPFSRFEKKKKKRKFL
jgi:hypothetical protein